MLPGEGNQRRIYTDGLGLRKNQRRRTDRAVTCPDLFWDSHYLLPGRMLRLNAILSGRRRLGVPWLFQHHRCPVWYFAGRGEQLSLADLENRPGLGTRVVEDKGLMNDTHELPGVREASRVSTTNVRVGHIVPALGYAFADSLNAPLRIIQTNEE